MTASSWIHIGLHGDYHWLEVEGDLHLGHLVSAFPELVHERFVAITANDSGVVRLADEDKAAGWEVRDGIAYSPRVQDGVIPRYDFEHHQCSGFDEWYVFDSPKNLGVRYEGDPFQDPPGPGRPFVFVNFLAFRLNTEDPSLEFVREWFWQQMDWMKPEAYIGDGVDCTFLVTKDGDLLERVVDYLYDIAS